MSTEQIDLLGEPIATRALIEKPRKPKKTGHAAPPGSAQNGETCRTCAHYCRAHGGRRAYPKCGLMRHAWTHGPGSDIKASSPACARWQSRLLGGGA